MSDDFREYEKMKEEGINSKIAYLYAVDKGLDYFSQIRMLRSVYNLSLSEAKEVTVTSKNESTSLTDHQEKLFPALKKLFEK